MPLVVLCGIPQSGKTTYVQRLIEFLRQHTELPILHINEEFLSIDKAQAYASNFTEKNLRALLKSTVERELSQSTIVILDSLNYIKGYRYELYCIVRTAQTTHCIVYIDTPVAQALEWNQTYSPELLQDLASRMEVPRDKNRWDKPLIFVRNLNNPLFEDVLEAVVAGRRPRPPVSTKLEETLDSNYVYAVDRETQAVIDFVLKTQEEFGIGCEVNLPDNKGTYQYTQDYSALQLKRKRKDFLRMNQQNPCPVASIQPAFVDYLNSLT